MPDQFQWELPPLDSADERLIDAYLLVGRPLEDLPYTDDFERLCRILKADDSDDARHLLYKRLLRLRTRGRLPRISLLLE